MVTNRWRGQDPQEPREKPITFLSYTLFVPRGHINLKHIKEKMLAKFVANIVFLLKNIPLPFRRSE